MRSLFPEASDRVNLVEVYSRGLKVPQGRPFVRVNMIATLDGATNFAGRSGGLGGPGDKLLFSVLRSLADAIFVGAGTVRAENYGPARLPVEVQQIREGRGQRPLPPIVVVTKSLDLDWAGRLFPGGEPRPIVIAPGDSSLATLARAARRYVLTTAAARGPQFSPGGAGRAGHPSCPVRGEAPGSTRAWRRHNWSMTSA